jgi:SET domain-containing protein
MGTYMDGAILVKQSEIHGYGIFAAIDIPAESIILKIKGEVISEEECILREERDNNVYIFWFDEKSYIDTVDSEKIKYINHNCSCNCEVIDGDDKSLLLITSTDITAGEELTIDYGYEEIYANCQCPKCA